MNLFSNVLAIFAIFFCIFMRLNYPITQQELVDCEFYAEANQISHKKFQDQCLIESDKGDWMFLQDHRKLILMRNVR